MGKENRKNMMGRRREDCWIGDLPSDIKPGDYWKYINKDGQPFKVNAPTNLTGTMWGVMAPNKCIGSLRLHTVRENEDGTITVKQGDGSSNSIAIWRRLDRSDEWHGYINNGVWEHI